MRKAWTQRSVNGSATNNAYARRNKKIKQFNFHLFQNIHKFRILSYTFLPNPGTYVLRVRMLIFGNTYQLHKWWIQNSKTHVAISLITLWPLRLIIYGAYV